MDVAKRMKNLDKITAVFDEMEVKDQLLFMLSLEQFLSIVDELADKYNTEKVHRFVLRRVEE